MNRTIARAWAVAALLVAPGCGATTPPLLQRPAATEGVQLNLEASAPAGADARLCRLLALPHALTLGRVESRATAGTHHVEVVLTALAPADADGAPFACASRPLRRVATIYSANQTAGDLTFAQGSTLPLAAGAVLLVEAHVLNASPAARGVGAAVNLYGADGAGPRLGAFELATERSPSVCRVAGPRFVQVLGGDGAELSLTLAGGALPAPIPLFEREPGDPLVFRPALKVADGEQFQLSCAEGACALHGLYFPVDADGLAACQE
jgi:hypothetical protein